LVYLIVGLILKNHTKIGTVQFKNYSTRFVIFYIIPLGGLLFYMVAGIIYFFLMAVSEVIFGIGASDSVMGLNDFFKDPELPKYPR